MKYFLNSFHSIRKLETNTSCPNNIEIGDLVILNTRKNNKVFDIGAFKVCLVSGVTYTRSDPPIPRNLVVRYWSNNKIISCSMRIELFLPFVKANESISFDDLKTLQT